MAVSVFSPAKLNLFLAITGRRADGFHDLVSVVAPLDFGDELHAASRARGAGGQFTLTCTDPAVPVDRTNLVLKAAQAFAAATGWDGGVDFKLTKRIPMGAGLGGGSSNAVAALSALNGLSGGLLPAGKLAEVAAGLGSDCVLFLKNAPAVMRGRGERVDDLSPGAVGRIRGRRVLVFKPGFGISTPWAYGRMVARGTDYLPTADAEAHLAAWLGGSAPVEGLLFNNMEPAAFEKHLALPVLSDRLRREFGLAVRMSGSGSACFALLCDPGADPGPAHDAGAVTRMKQRIRAAWGDETFVQEARLS